MKNDKNEYINNQLSSQKKFLRSIINSITHPLYVIDVETYNIALSNKATDLSTFLGNNTCHALTHNSNIPCGKRGHQCPVDIVRKTKETCVIEHIHFNDGEKKIFEVHGFPIFDDNNEVTQVIEYNIDITEKKKLEEALIKEKEKANENNILKTAFLANMSHEIRTPMNAIMGFGELLKNESITSEKRMQYIDIINSSGKYLLELIDDIIDISKIETKQLKISLTEVKLVHLMNEISIFFNSEIHKDVILSINSKLKEATDFIITDIKRLKQILINLIGNSLKFTSKGSITVNYSIYKKKLILFEIIDTGIGISKKDLPHIFERFRQVGNKKDFYKGTGLGLAISKGCVELLGGEISVKSSIGKGTEFNFTIPYNPVN